MTNPQLSRLQEHLGQLKLFTIQARLETLLQEVRAFAAKKRELDEREVKIKAIETKLAADRSALDKKLAILVS